MTAADPGDRVLIARMGAHASWANTPTSKRSARTQPARDARDARFVAKARELYGDLPEAELLARAEHLRKAHFSAMALKSAQARRARKGAAAQ